MKKKVLFTLMAAMLVTAAVPVFAAENTTGKGEQSIEVQGKYQDRTTSDTVYSVDISWEQMEFTYAESGTKTWNPKDHTYVDHTTAGWEANGNKISVINHSNADVNVAFDFSAVKDFAGVEGTFDVTSRTLKAGVLNEYENADRVDSVLSLTGSLEKNVTEFTKVGEVTITID